MSDSDSVVDLLVFGGGMAGMSAAARACSDGASVILVEKGAGDRRLGDVRRVSSGPHRRSR